MNTALSCLSFRRVQFDVVDHQGQPWLRSQQISVALGYGRGDQVNDLYARNSDEFTDAMTALVPLQTLGGLQESRIFSLRGCHLLGMLARTAIAKEFRKWVLDVLDQQSAFNAHPDIEMYGTIAGQMAEGFLDYLTGVMAEGPVAIAELPPLQRAIARLLQRRDTDLRLPAHTPRATWAPIPVSADWQPLVAAYLADKTRVTADQIIIEVLGEQPTKSLQVQVGLAMRRLCWTHKQRTTTGDRSRYYYYQRPA